MPSNINSQSNSQRKGNPQRRRKKPGENVPFLLVPHAKRSAVHWVFKTELLGPMRWAKSPAAKAQQSELDPVPTMEVEHAQ